MRPEIYIVAGAPGSGKSRAFPVSEFGVEYFNADDRAALLNDGSYHAISLEQRARVNRELEAFIQDHIERRVSFAFETTLRSGITFDQIDAARWNGFRVTMLYIGIEDPEINIARIAIRWDLGYHAAPRDVLMAIHGDSLKNLRIACRKANSGHIRLMVYDNTTFDHAPVPVLEVAERSILPLIDPLPRWVELAVRETDFKFPPMRR